MCGLVKPVFRLPYVPLQREQREAGVKILEAVREFIPGVKVPRGRTVARDTVARDPGVEAAMGPRQSQSSSCGLEREGMVMLDNRPVPDTVEHVGPGCGQQQSKLSSYHPSDVPSPPFPTQDIRAMEDDEFTALASF